MSSLCLLVRLRRWVHVTVCAFAALVCVGVQACECEEYATAHIHASTHAIHTSPIQYTPYSLGDHSMQ